MAVFWPCKHRNLHKFHNLLEVLTGEGVQLEPLTGEYPGASAEHEETAGIRNVRQGLCLPLADVSLGVWGVAPASGGQDAVRWISSGYPDRNLVPI